MRERSSLGGTCHWEEEGVEEIHQMGVVGVALHVVGVALRA